jgi:hypothetical protein
VVSWLSAHLAALDRSVYPMVKRNLPDGPAVVARQRRTAVRLAHTLRAVERRHSGDALASGLDSSRLLDNVRHLLDEHSEAEAQLLDRLAAALHGTAANELVADYERALIHAPTRPHPHLSRGGLMFRLDALRDNVLDTMDGRHVPVPRLTRRHITPGRWGSYILGQPHDEDRDAG